MPAKSPTTDVVLQHTNRADDPIVSIAATCVIPHRLNLDITKLILKFRLAVVSNGLFARSFLNHPYHIIPP